MKHLSVLLDEAVRELVKDISGIYLDCTFGRGGHSRKILQHLDSRGTLLAFDRDADAVNSAEAVLLLQDGRFVLRQACFSELERIVTDQGWHGKIDGILMDLGVSSPQLDTPERGFSFLKDGPLDMRMDGNSGLTAAQWLEQVNEQELVQVLFDYGEERFARRIARAIIEQRDKSPLLSTRQLAGLIEVAVPVREKHKHPATRSFQAIRIAINRELEELQQVLEQAVSVLKPGGRLVVISFHSLEDRIVKRFIRNESRGKYISGRLPLPENARNQGRLVKVGKAWRAGKKEVERNPRSRSAVMRVAERVVWH